MDKKIFGFLLASLLVACSSPTKPPLTSSTQPDDGSKSVFSAGDNITLASNGLDSQTSSQHSHANSQPHTRQSGPPKQESGAPRQERSSSLVASSHGLSYWIERLSPSGGVQRVSASTLFHSGDRIRIHVRTNRPGYLYVVNQGSSGRGSYLYPASANANEYVEPSRVYQIPTSGNIVFDNQPGQEIVWLFLSQRPLPVDNAPQSQIKPSGERSFKQASYNPCGSKDLVVEAPDELQSSCGAGSKDLALEDDNQSTEPATKVTFPSEVAEKGQILALRLVLKHD